MANPTPQPESLESGELLFLPQAPFALPTGDDHAFLLEQQPGGLRRKHICYDPTRDEVTGFVWQSWEQAERLRRILAEFSQAVTCWLKDSLPRYQRGITPDLATFRPEEAATRRARPHARNDLLHVDAFPGRPARGRRILRVFANIHPSEVRVWATSEPLSRLLHRYADRVRQSSAGWFHEWGARLTRLLRVNRPCPSDVFMLRLHDYLKSDFDFQQRGSRRLWRFPPGSVWLAMTDACSHADLRGQFALEHSFFISPEVLACPELAPAHLLRAG